MTEYLIEINTYTSYDIPSIGMTGGIIQWSPNGYNTITPVDGLIGDKWVSRVFSGAKIDDGGGLAYTGGTTILLLAQSQVYDTLKSLNIENSNKPLTIKMRDSYTGTESTVYRGVVVGIREDVDNIVITVDDISRNRESDSIYPYYLGEGQLIELEKTEVVSEVVEPLLNKSPLFYSKSSSYEFCTVLPYLVEPTETEMQTWVNGVNADKKGSFFINGVKIPTFLSRGDYTIGATTYQGLELSLEYNVNNSQGVLVDSGTIEPVEITDRYNTYSADTFDSGGFADSVLRYEDGSELGKVYSDEIVFGTTTITSYEYDNIGYKNIQLSNSLLNGMYIVTNDMKIAMNIDHMTFVGDGWYLKNSNYNSVTTTSLANSSNIIDNDYSTYGLTTIVIDTDLRTNNAGNEVAKVLRVDLPKLDSSKKYYLNVSIRVPYFTGIIQGGLTELLTYNKSSIIGVGYRSGSTGSDYEISAPIIIGDDFGGAGTAFDTLPLSNFTIFDNRFPLLENKPNESEEPFRWQADGEGLEDGCHGFTIPLDTILGDIDISAGGCVYLCSYINLSDGTGGYNSFTEFHIAYHNISIVEEVELPLDPIYTKWDGRKVGGTVVSNTSQAYDLACRLQNLSDANVTKPNDGWGTVEPTVADWTTLINTSSSYGGIYSLPRTLLANVEDATNLKKELAVSMVALGAVDNDGIENLYSLADGLYNTDGLLITYDDLLEDSEPNWKRLDQSRIYNEFDIGTVQVTDVDGDWKDTQPYELWKMGNALYRAYGIKKRYKKENYIIGDDAEKFPRDLMRWFGCYDEGLGNWIVRERGTLAIELPISYALSNQLNIGMKVRFEDSDGSIVSGIVYQRDYGLIENPNVKLEIHFVSSKTVSGGDTILIVETGTNIDIIEETGSNTNTIVEGQI